MENELTLVELRTILHNRDYDKLQEIIPGLNVRDAIYYCDEYRDNYEAINKLKSCGQPTNKKEEKEKLLLLKLMAQTIDIKEEAKTK